MDHWGEVCSFCTHAWHGLICKRWGCHCNTSNTTFHEERKPDEYGRDDEPGPKHHPVMFPLEM